MKRDFHKHYVEGHTLIKKKLGKKFIEYADIMCGSDDLEDKKVTKFIKKYNAAPRECWAFDSNLAMYLYEHIKMFEDTTIADIDSTDELFMYSIPTWESYINGGKDDERTYEFIDVTLHQALDKIAHWVYINLDKVAWPKTYQYSNCNAIIVTNTNAIPEEDYHYCPKCGARMVGDENAV